MSEVVEVLYEEAFDVAYDEMKENNPARYYSEKLPERHHINEKFAELIVKECLNIIDSCETCEYAMLQIKQKFGVL